MFEDKAQAIRVFEDTHTIIQRGWCRNKYKKGDRHCLIGALATACNLQLGKFYGSLDIYDENGVWAFRKSGSSESAQLFNECLDFLQELIPDEVAGLPTWNDQQKSKKPVLTLITDAIGVLNGKV